MSGLNYYNPRVLFPFLIIFSFLGLMHTQAQEKFVSVYGKDIIYHGKPLLLKGINLGNWLEPEGYMFKFKKASSTRLINEVISELLGPEKANRFWETFRNRYITNEDITFIKNSGLNSIRIPFDYRLFLSESHPGINYDTGFKLLDRVIGWCKENNIWVILDLHCAPGGQTGDNIDNGWGYPFLFESTSSQQLTADLWKKIADHYKNEPDVIGYDLLNEPIAPYFNTEKLNKQLEPVYKKIVSAIREVDKNHIVFLGGAQWDSNFKVFGKPFDSKSVYTFHKYWSDTTQSVIQEYVDFRNKNNVPVWLGESGENTDKWISSFKNLLEKNNIGWCFWPYKKLDSSRGMISINIPADYDSVITFEESPRTSFEEIRKAMPSNQVIQKSLEGFLENIKFNNCAVNKGYLKGLGLKSK
ncbi:MAG TPA: glycoside hydrolase family 5 protein [Ignavibacteriaceae bacterium]|nr:glycoside hydrolase family 5 protein [Ignavibacteriaceae bacterium]